MNRLLIRVISGAMIGVALTGCQKQEEAVLSEVTLKAQSTKDSKISILPGHYIVVLKNNVAIRGTQQGETYSQALEKVKEQSAKLQNHPRLKKIKIKKYYAAVFKGFAAELTDSELQEVANSPEVAFVEPDRVTVIDDPSSVLNSTSGGDEQIDVNTLSQQQVISYGVSKAGYGSGSQKTAWIIDTGIDLTHPDLLVDVANSRSFVSEEGPDKLTSNDLNGHGTHVAGIIGAQNNSIGTRGVAAGATLVAVKVVGQSGNGTTSDLVAGIDYVASKALPGEVVNISLATDASKTVDDAVVALANRGIKIVVGAGNKGMMAKNYSPARVSHSNVYTVSAINKSNIFASFSNYGNPPIEYAAPGVNVVSCWMGGTYKMASGTSMAAPHVTGLLLMSSLKVIGYAQQDRDRTPDAIAGK